MGGTQIQRTSKRKAYSARILAAHGRLLTAHDQPASGRYMTTEEAADVRYARKSVRIARYTRSIVGPESTMQLHSSALALCCLT